MFTTSLFLHADQVSGEPRTEPIAIIWKRTYGHWEFFTRSPIEEAEAIVTTDMFLSGSAREHYRVQQG